MKISFNPPLRPLISEDILAKIREKHHCLTPLQQQFAEIADHIVAEGWNHVWFVVNGRDYFVYDNGDILHELDMERG